MAFDAFRKIAGIDGESTDEKHTNWIEILSYSWSVSLPQATTPSKRGVVAARATFRDFSIHKRLDKASPKLMLACASGQHFKAVTLELCRTGGDKQPFVTYKFGDVIITSVAPSGDTGSDLSSETVSFSYGQIEWKYTKLDPQSGIARETVTAGWDIKKNKKL